MRKKLILNWCSYAMQIRRPYNHFQIQLATYDMVRNSCKFFSHLPQKPKGFQWSQSLINFVQKKIEAVSLCEVTEVKMKAKSEIRMKF